MSRKIAIVGNGTFDPSQSPVIDAADVVIRFNDCRSYGPGGTKTDIVAVCNTGRPGLGMIGGGTWKSAAAVQRAAEIWCVRDGGKFRELRPLLADDYPELDDFFDDYTQDFADFAQQSNKAFAVIPRAVHDRLETDLSGLRPEAYVVPSSGLVTIAHVLSMVAAKDDAVIIAGFDHTGWSGHPFGAERALIRQWIRSGRISRI